MRRRLIGWILIGLCASRLSFAQNVVGDEEFDAFFDKFQTLLETESRCEVITIYLAAESQQRTRGLMFVQKMALDTGMLFIYPPESRVSMWMKNTVIPLDIVFIDSAGIILNIAKSTEPYSLTPVRAAGPASYALELNAGVSDHLGLRDGQQLFRPAWLSW